MHFVTFQKRKNSLRAGLLLEGNRLLDLSMAYSRRPANENASVDDTTGLINSLRGVSSSLVEILRIGDEALTDCYTFEKLAMEGSLEDCVFAMGDATLAAPIPDPPVVLLFNVFKEHAIREFAAMSGDENGDLPLAWFRFPVYLAGNPLAIDRPGARIKFPVSEDQMDFECHLAAVLSEDLRNASVDDAEHAILGYTLANVWAARQTQKEQFLLGTGATRGKGFAITAGPAIVTKDALPDPEDLEVHVSVNNQELRSGKSGPMEFSFGEMISYASEGTTLPAGTLILTGGLPDGSRIGRGQYLQPGDVVEMSAEGIGKLTNQVDEYRSEQIYVPKDDRSH